MQKRDPVANHLIDQIGADVVRDHFGLSPQSLCNWRARGIPQLKRIAFQNLALTRGIALPPGFLAELGIAA